MSMPKLDWAEITEGYNRRCKTSFESDFDMISKLYSNLKHIRNTAVEIGVGPSQLADRMKLLGIKSNPRGGPLGMPRNGKHRSRLKKLPDEVTAKMTIAQISKKLGCHRTVVEKGLAALNKPFKILRHDPRRYKNG